MFSVLKESRKRLEGKLGIIKLFYSDNELFLYYCTLSPRWTRKNGVDTYRVGVLFLFKRFSEYTTFPYPPLNETVKSIID